MSAKYKRISPRSQDKQARSYQVLLGLVELYIQTGRPVGSQQLQREGFPQLSPATIRNYLAELEELGLLQQQHSSAGRIPSEHGLRLYAHHAAETPLLHPEDRQLLDRCGEHEGRDVGTFLQKVLEALSVGSGCVACGLSPRFDHDFVQSIRLVGIDNQRILVVLITDFGFVSSELVQVEESPGFLALKRLEQALQAKLCGDSKELAALEERDQAIAQQLYSESMLRHIVRYAQFWEEEVTYTGVSRLIQFPEFAQVRALGEGISLLDHPHALRSLLKDCMQDRAPHFWVGSDLPMDTRECSVLAIPYSMQGHSLGAIGLLGPMRIPYSRLMGLLQHASEMIQTVLTRCLYKHRISYRQPQPHVLYLPTADQLLIHREGPAESFDSIEEVSIHDRSGST